MTTKRKSSRMLAMMLAVFMVLSIVPMSIFTVAAADPTAVTLQNGKVALSADMTDDEVKTALFNALVTNPDGKNALDYEWEFYDNGYDKGWGWWDWAWGSIKGFTHVKRVALTDHYYDHGRLASNSAEGNWQVRLAGATQEATLTKVNTCNVTFNFDETQGKVTANGAAVANGQTVNGVSPKKAAVVTVEPSTGYNVLSVKVNGKDVEAVDGAYSFIPVADTTVDVAFEEIKEILSTLTLNAAEGVTYKVNGFDAAGTFDVPKEEESTIEFITAAGTSIDKILVDGADVTADVAFNNYNGTYKTTFANDAAIEVVPVKSEIKLTGATKIPVFKDSNDSWDYAKMEEGVVKTLIADGTIPANYKAEEIEVTYNCEPYRSSFTKYVPLNYTPGGINVAFEWSFWNLFYYTGAGNPAPHEAQLRLKFKGNSQYRASDYVYVTVTLDELPTVNIALKDGAYEAALNEIPAENGYTYDFAAFEKAVYDAVIDEINSYPDGVVNADTVKLMYYKTSTWDTNDGWVEIGARCPGGDHTHAGWFLEDVFSNGSHEFKFKAVVASTEEYYGSEKEFTVKVTANPIATAEIGIKDGYDKNFDLIQNYDRSFDYTAFETALRDRVIGECKLVNPADVMFKYDIKADGTYTVTAYAPETASYHYTEVTFEVVVNVVDNYTAEIVVDEANNNFNIYETSVNNYDYAALKQAIVEQMFTINNVQGAEITADDIHFMYVIYDDGALIKDYIEFEERRHASDTNEVLYNYLHEGGTFKCWAELKADGESYYGTEVYFTINVTPVNVAKTSITAKENATVTLTQNHDRSFDYDGLKKAVFDNILTVNGLPEGTSVTYKDLEFMYVIYDDGAAIKDYIPFEQETNAGDSGAIYHFLKEGGEFRFWAKLPNADNYYGSEVYFTANVEVEDVFTAKIALKEDYQRNFNLNQIMADGAYTYDYEQLKKDIYNAVIDEANSHPQGEIKYENVKLTYKILDGIGGGYGSAGDFYNFEQGQLGDDYENTFKYLYKGGTFTIKAEIAGNDLYYGSSVEFEVVVNTTDLPVAEIAVKDTFDDITVEKDYDRDFDKAKFENDVYNAVIDEAASKFITRENIFFRYDSAAVLNGGAVEVEAYVNDAENYHGTAKKFTVNVNIVDNFTAEIVINEEAKDFVLEMNADRSYNYDKLKQDIFANAIAEIKNAPADLTWEDIEFTYVLTDGMLISYNAPFDAKGSDYSDPGETLFTYLHDGGSFTFKAALADGEGYYGDTAEFTANVTIKDLPTVEITAADNATVNLIQNKDRTFNYAQFKQDIINDVLTVNGLPDGAELTADDYEIQYKWTDGLWYQYDTIDRDCTVEFWAKVPDGYGYYGDEVYFTMTVKVSDEFTAKIALNENYNREFNLNEIMVDGAYTYDYEQLRKDIYAAVINETASYPQGAVTYDSIKLTYDVTDGMLIHYDAPFEAKGSDYSDPEEALFSYLHDGGTFKIKAALADTDDYYGDSVEFDVNVNIKKLPDAGLAVKEGYDKNFTLTQNYDRSFNYAAFEDAMYEAVIDEAASEFITRENVKFDYDIKADGTYTVKAYVNETAEFHYSEITFEVKVDVIDSFTAEIVVDENNNNFEIKETDINVYDYAALKQAIVDQMFTINNIPKGVKITAEDIHFMYVIYDDGALIQDYIEFEERQHAGDTNEILYNYLHEGGTFKCWAELPNGEGYYGDEVYFTINVTPAGLPKTSITARENATVTLNINKDRTYDYAGLKQAMLNELLTVSGLPEGAAVTADDIHFMYVIYDDGAAIDDYVEFEERQHAGDADEILYHYLHQGGEFQFWAELANTSAYYGSEVYFKANVAVNDDYTTKIVLKEDYQKNFTLYYNADQSFDYERLHKELFDAIIDTANSSANVTFENTAVTYDVTDGMLIHYPDSPLNTVGSDVSDPEETLFTYLHEGGTFAVKFAVPTSGGLYGNSVTVSLNIGPFDRIDTSIVLNGNASMDYVADPAAVKQYIFDNVISKELSVLPEGVTIDSFTFEYWAQKYLAGGTPGADTDKGWAPFEGADSIMGTYYRPIGAGDHYFRVMYNGSADYKPSDWTSGYEIISLPKADFDISLKQDYIYRGDQLPNDFVQMSANTNGADMKYRMLFTTTTNEGNALVYLQSRDGYPTDDFIWDLQNEVIINVFHGAKTGESILREGLSVDEYKQLINSPELAAYFAKWYDMTEADMEVFRTAAFSRLGGMNHVIIRLGTPRHAAHYDLFVGVYNESFKTQVMHTGMYVKYNSSGAKLQWRESATGLNTINSKSFDFGADATKDGISQSDGNVKYLYTGLFYCSSNAPRGKTGFFIQTAWTKAGTMYCFPITRSFRISVL